MPHTITPGRRAARSVLGAALAVVLGTTLAPAATATTAGDPGDEQPAGASWSCTTGESRSIADAMAVSPEVPGVTRETEIRWTRATTALIWGGVGVLEGQVVTDAGAVPDADVDLYARPHSASGWRLVSTATTDSETGVFAFDCVRPQENTRYRVVHESTTFHGRSTGERHIDVRRSVPDAIRQVGPTAFVLRGAVAPDWKGPVHLQRRDCERCSWSTVDTTRTRKKSRWRFGLDVAGRRGEMWFRVVVPAGGGFARSFGEHVWPITVR